MLFESSSTLSRDVSEGRNSKQKQQQQNQKLRRKTTTTTYALAQYWATHVEEKAASEVEDRIRSALNPVLD